MQGLAKRDDKRNKVLGRKTSGPAKKPSRWVFPVVFGALLVGMVILGAVQQNAGRKSYDAAARIEQVPIPVAQAGGTITVPLSEIKEKRLVGFAYQGQGKSLPLLAYLAPSGKVVTAVSMCEPCNSTTFHIEGTELVCNTCGTRWDLENLRGLAGGCQAYPPDAFPNSLSGERVVVQETSVASWQPRV